MKSGDPGTCAPCVFQRLCLVGKGLDGELAQLVPLAGLTSAQTDAVIPAGTPLPSRSRSLKAEFRASTRTPELISSFRFFHASFFRTPLSCSLEFNGEPKMLPKVIVWTRKIATPRDRSGEKDSLMQWKLFQSDSHFISYIPIVAAANGDGCSGGGQGQLVSSNANFQIDIRRIGRYG